jgi:hypothetical protein
MRTTILAAFIVATAATAAGQRAASSITLSQYTYQTVKSTPFNGQLAFYVGDIVSSNNQVKLPLTVRVLIGNGRRPFATDTGSMKSQDFDVYASRLKSTKMVQVIDFRISNKGDVLPFRYLSKQYTLTVTDLIPCRGCDDRVILSLQQR